MTQEPMTNPTLPTSDPERPEHAPQHDGGRDMKRREEEQERREQADRSPARER
jgi:hypothetical protein